MAAASPLPLSDCSELERQCHVVRALAKLLECPEADQYPADALNLEELQELRCTVHRHNLDNCRHESRLAVLSYALQNDADLRAAEFNLETESERQGFWNNIHDRIMKKDFSSFSFSREAFESYWESEKANRASQLGPRGCLLKQYTLNHQELIEKHLDKIGNELRDISSKSIERSHTAEARVDALTTDDRNTVWVAAELVHPPVSWRCALDLVVVVDLSGSMCDTIDLLKETLHDIIARLQPEDQVSVIGFSHKPKLLCDWTCLLAPDARANLSSRINSMQAKGGTNLVNALHMAQEQLQSLKALPPHQDFAGCAPIKLMPCHGGHKEAQPVPAKEMSKQSRVAAVVLLSDGYPEEPEEAVCTAACQLIDKMLPADLRIVSLALGSESHPALMSLVAQCGVGPSFYIGSTEQLPEQLGRIWGYLNALTCDNNIFLLLEPLDGSEIVEVERSLGGFAKLQGAGKQQVVMSCGSHVRGCAQQLAFRIKLPSWAHEQVEANSLQRPLLLMTWIWQQAPENKLQRAVADLRVIQIPSLFVEAHLGIPVRLVLDVDWEEGEIDKSAMLRALAAAVNVPSDKFTVAKITKGSVIIDIGLHKPTSLEFNSLQGACTPSADHRSSASNAMVADGYPVKALLAPGSTAFKRMLQWSFAKVLETASQKSADVADVERMLTALEEQATSNAAMTLDPDPSGAAAAIAADIVATKEMLRSSDEMTNAMSHTLMQQAHAHCQQICPELHPVSVSVRAYETTVLRESAETFCASAAARECHPSQALVQSVGSDRDWDHGTIKFKVSLPGETSIAVLGFRVCVSWHEGFIEEEYTMTVDEVAHGVTLVFRDLPPGEFVQVVVHTTNGRVWGSGSTPLKCKVARSSAQSTMDSTAGAENAMELTGAGSSTQKSKRKSSRGASAQLSLLAQKRSLSRKPFKRQAPELVINSAVLKSPDKLFLSWTTEGEMCHPPERTWIITLTSLKESSRVIRHEVKVSSVEVDGVGALGMSRFCVEAFMPKAREVPSSRNNQLYIQGSSCGSRFNFKPVEGFITNGTCDTLDLESLGRDVKLEQLSAGVYLIRCSRNS